MTNNFCALCADLIEAVLSDDSHIDCTEIARRARAALGEADEPAVPEGRDPAAVTKQPSDAEQVLRLAAIIREVDGNHSKGAAALAESILDHPGFRVVLASWGTSNLTQTKLSPAAGEVVGLVKMLKGIAYWRLHGTDKPTPFDIRQAARLTRAAELLQRQALVPVSVSEPLPGPEDCDAEGRCWFGTPGCDVWGASWVLRKRSHQRNGITSWLPAHSLPLPEVGE